VIAGWRLTLLLLIVSAVVTTLVAGAIVDHLKVRPYSRIGAG
jgi:hypothetical protein